ncbi:MAG: hypothetical protein QOH05_308, partial [Acetobacteraceae bacterium]|nr:hypothetical protein [Acetobacteraceae bacterium]
MATGPLDGMRVLDFTTTIAGPYCTRMMADLGAEVIKVETTEGDMMRSRPPLRNSASTSFGQLNAGKQSIVLDLKHPQAQKIIRRLLTTSDFLVENFRPGVMQRFTLDYETLAPGYPKLIYCSISGYGQTGPASHLPGYDAVLQGAAGIMDMTGFQEGEPTRVGVAITDYLAGLYATQGI